MFFFFLAAALALLLERFRVECWFFFGRRPPRCHHFREGGLLAAHQGWPLGCCFCAASGLLFRVELCVCFSFLADPAGLASFGCPHGSLAVLTLLSLPFCLSV